MGGIGGVWGCIDRFVCMIKEALSANESRDSKWNLVVLYGIY